MRPAEPGAFTLQKHLVSATGGVLGTLMISMPDQPCHSWTDSLNQNLCRPENRRDTLTSPIVRKINAQALATLTTQIEKIDREIKACIVQDEELLSEVHIMTMTPGVSFIYSCRDWFRKAIFCEGIVRLIRIGSANYRIKFECTFIFCKPKIIWTASANSLSGFGPGVPKIPVLQEFHQRLMGKGKKKMTVRCACMRKCL